MPTYTLAVVLTFFLVVSVAFERVRAAAAALRCRLRRREAKARELGSGRAAARQKRSAAGRGLPLPCPAQIANALWQGAANLARQLPSFLTLLVLLPPLAAAGALAEPQI